nr:MAG TPA: hypothetical protein [Caudoviricetes sp.]
MILCCNKNFELHCINDMPLIRKKSKFLILDVRAYLSPILFIKE